ncbi:hypothetical protein AB0D57_06435 [Streptomyces sp. NPDC048275]|uniref:hypothetical protein n=1 Tax=Streptomyces sp. NPDC048275 TaxID=3155629 RepID=UPI0033F53DE9
MVTLQYYLAGRGLSAATAWAVVSVTGVSTAFLPAAVRKAPHLRQREPHPGARDMLPDLANSVTTIAKTLGVSISRLHSHIPGLKELRNSRVPRQLEGTSQPTPNAPCGGGRRHEL